MTRPSPRLLSVVVPFFNEEDVIPLFFSRLEPVLRTLALPFEVIAVDDGSQDQTRAKLLTTGSLPELKVVCLSRNFGLAGALEAGLAQTNGEAVVVMDGDLQDPPELIPVLLNAWREGGDVVFTTKRSREEHGLRKLAFAVFHYVQHRLAHTPAPLGTGNFSLMDRRVLEAMRTLPERGRYLPGLRYWVGFKQVEVAFDRPARASGQPKMTVGKLARLALDGIFGFSHLPLRVATLLGLVACLLGVVLVAWVLVERFITHTAILGWPSLMIAICFLGGAQLVCVGILGEYIARVFDEVRRRPSFIISEVLRPADEASRASSPGLRIELRAEQRSEGES